MLPIDFDPSLPVNQRREEIAATILKNQVVILCGETGSGKTTQLPKICLSIGRGEKGRIAHTQPRRIAARTVASRIAEELKSRVGELVGFKIRFSDHSSRDSQIKLMTDGILLAEIQSDPQLRQYDTIIIDEAHERSLNIDFLLGYLQQLIPRRPDLKLIITSATIDPQRFSKHFSNAPVVEVSGRTYPVEMRYRPMGDEEAVERGKNQQQQNLAILEAVSELSRAGPGDILVFLSGEREIRESAEFLQKSKLPQTEVLPLFSRLSAKEQNRIFNAHSGRRIILSTNVAETSLTVPGIRYVVDTGRARISRYSHRSGIQRLPVEKISQASANQRKGRCGRVSDGICIRLYSEDDFQSRPLFTDPEIMRTHLAPVILQMAALSLGRPDQFPFINPPDLRLIRDGYRALHELGAVSKNSQITPLGRKISRFPVDPQIARMLLAAEREGSLREILIIAAALSIQDPRERPLDAQQAADQKHEPFQDENSDFLLYINLWNFYEEQKRELSNNQLRKLCRTNFLSWMRMREWREVHTQLRQLCREMKLKENSQPADYGMVHRALLSGLLSHLATIGGERYLYAGARGVEMRIWPGSGQFKSSSKWIVAAEKVETSQLYARTVARIEPQWIERIGRHLLKRSYAEPHWEKRRGQVAAFETVTIYGLPIVSRRRVNYGPVDSVESRKIFIRSALVDGEVFTRGQFLQKNRKLIENIESLEAKSRRRDILVDDETFYQFYDEHIPKDVYSTPAFEKWRTAAEKSNPDLLILTQEGLMMHDATKASDTAQFPDHITIGPARVPLHYHFEPGSEDDGVTMTIPTELLPQLRIQQFEWLVPGLLRERIIAMIRALPKSWRRNFVPAADFADAVLPSLDQSKGALGGQLSAKLRQMTGVTLPAGIWDGLSLPDHLQMRFQVIRADGATEQVGRELSQLQRRNAPSPEPTAPSLSFTAVKAHPLEREVVEQWDFGPLPNELEVERHGIVMSLYPALVATEKGASHTLSLQLLETPEDSERENRNGVTVLFLKLHKGLLRKMLQEQINKQQLCLHYLSIGNCDALTGELLLMTARQSLFQRHDDIPRDPQQFQRRSDSVLQEMPSLLKKHAVVIEDILQQHHTLMRQLNGNIPPTQLLTYAKIKSHIETLIYPGFLTRTPMDELSQLPRYLQAVEKRLEKLRLDPQQDRKRAQLLAPFWDPLEKRINSGRSPQFIEYRWLLEEYRVSIFAQELGTKKPVSANRLKKLWQKL